LRNVCGWVNGDPGAENSGLHADRRTACRRCARALGIVGAADLAPLAGAIDRRLALLEGLVRADRRDEAVIGDEAVAFDAPRGTKSMSSPSAANSPSSRATSQGRGRWGSISH